MSRRTILILAAAGALAVVAVLASVVRYVPDDEIALIRTGDTARQVPSGFLFINPLRDKLERIPARRFEVRGFAGAQTSDGYGIRLPFTAVVNLDASQFQTAVGDLGDTDARTRVTEILEDVVAAWGSTFPAATFLLRDLSDTAALSARAALVPGGIHVQSLILERPDPDLYLFLAEDALSRGDPGERMGLVEAGLERYPGDARLVTARGMLLEAGGDWPGAEADYLEALRIRPGMEPPLSRLFRHLREEGDGFRLEKLLLDALDANPESTRIRSWLALTCRDQERYDDALAYLEEALRRSPDDEPTLTNLGGMLQELGRYDEAAEVYRQALELRPRSQLLLFNLGMAEMERGDLPAARDALEKSRAAGPGAPRLHNLLAEVYRRSGMPDRALAELQASFRLAPEQAGLRDAIASLGGELPE